MKVLWHSNAPWAATGYGKQTRLFAPRVAALGHDVALSAFFGLEGARLEVDGLPLYPKGRDRYGNDVLVKHARDFFGHPKGGLVVTLTDVWVIRPEVLRELNAAAWVPVDHEPCQPPTVETLRKGKVVPIAMSRFGERMLLAERFVPVYVPHGFDGSVFTPRDRAEARKLLRFPADAYIVGMVAANKGLRKSYPQAVRAFARFRRRHPDALLYLHTNVDDPEGLNLHVLFQQELGDDAGKSVILCDQYRYQQGLHDDDYLATAYSAIDLLLNPAQGEGFGVPIIEAQACGTPVLVTRATAMPELIGDGYAVGGAPIYTSLLSWQLLPSEDELEGALAFDYGLSERDRTRASDRAVSFAAAYEADRVTEEFWAPALSALERRFAR